MVGELASFVSVQCGWIKTTADHFEAIQVSGVVLFKGSNESLHIEFSVNLALPHIGNANFDFIAKLSCFFFGFGDSSFIAIGEFNG